MADEHMVKAIAVPILDDGERADRAPGGSSAGAVERSERGIVLPSTLKNSR
jgi:hypothetical protein